MISGPQATPLRLIHAGIVSIVPVSRMLPRVLTDELVERLRALNAAVRALRAMDIRVVSTTLAGEFPADGEPAIRIERQADASIAALLDAAEPRSFWCKGVGRDAVTTASCQFMGVTVMWEERL